MEKTCKIIIITLMALSIGYLLGGYKHSFRYEYEKATAVMESKKYDSGGMTIVGDIVMPEPDDYYVYLRSGEVTSRINNRLIYKQFEQDKEIDVYIEKMYNKRNELISQRIVLFKPKDK